MKEPDHNLIGQLLFMEETGMKPNFSALQKEYGIDRHTIKKYYENGGKRYKKRPPIPSKYDPYEKEAAGLLANPSSSIMAVWQFLRAEHPEFPGTYSGMKAWVRHAGMPHGKAIKIHPRYETGPGKQLQFDWVEDLRMTLKSGETVTFNLFSATYGFSRLHRFVFSETRTTEDFIRCLIEVMRTSGGTTEEDLTDNMAAIVSITNGSRRKHPKVLAFQRDIGVDIRLCRPRSPQTKGKVESANRFAKWLEPYQGRLSTVAEIVDAIAAVEAACNAEPNRTTSLPPIALWGKEKEALRPVPSRALMESYLDGAASQEVPPTLLVNFRGKSYSVPAKYAGRRADVMQSGGGVYVGGKLAAWHPLEGAGPINYSESDYMEAMAASCRDGADISAMAEESLSRLASLGGD